MILVKFLGNLEKFYNTLESAKTIETNIVCLNVPNISEFSYPKVNSIAEAQDLCQEDFFIYLQEGDVFLKTTKVFLKKHITHYQALFIRDNIRNFFPLFYNNSLKWKDDLTLVDENFRVKTLYFDQITIQSDRFLFDDYYIKMQAAINESDLTKSIADLLSIWSIYKRAEPLFYIAFKYRESKQYDLGYIFAKKASKINLSFQYSNWEEDVYQWKILDELSVCAYWTKKYRESFSISKKILSLVPISEQPRIKNNINYCRPYLPKKTKIKFKEKINPALAEAIAHLSLSSSNIIEVNRSDNGITGIICHYAPEKVTHVFVNRSKQIIKSVFKKIKEKKLNKPSYKLFNQLVFVPNNIDFLILNDTKKTSEKTLETLWDKIKSEGKILISNKSYLKYINKIKTAYPDYKESGYALIIKK